MKYRICYVTTLPNTIRFFLLDSVKYLFDKNEFDITLICNETDGFINEIPKGVKYIPVKMKRGFSATGIKSTIDLYRIFKKEQFDLVQYSTSNAGCYASIAACAARIPIRLYGQWGLDYPHLKGIKRFVFETIERVICSNSTHIQPDSYDNLELSIREKLYSRSKGDVVWHGSASGVDLKRFDIKKKVNWRKEIREQFCIPNDAFVFGYVGRLLGQKGINELLDSVRRLFSDSEDVFLLLVGDPNNTEGVNPQKLNWANETKRVIFAGFTSCPEKYYAAMDCFVFPSYLEGFGTAIIEAEAMGVPVIATDIPGPREAINNGQTGVLVESKNAEQLYLAMRDKYDDQEKTKEQGKKAVDYVKNNFEQSQLFEHIYLNRKELLKKYGRGV